MILHFDTPPPRNNEPVGEAWERHEALLRALRRMGFHDPEALAGPAPARPARGGTDTRELPEAA